MKCSLAVCAVLPFFMLAGLTPIALAVSAPPDSEFDSTIQIAAGPLTTPGLLSCLGFILDRGPLMRDTDVSFAGLMFQGCGLQGNAWFARNVASADTDIILDETVINPAPGVPFAELRLFIPSQVMMAPTRADVFAIAGSIVGDGAPDGFSSGVFTLNASGQITLALQTKVGVPLAGSPPDLPLGARIASRTLHDINARGEVVVRGLLTPGFGGVTASDSEALFGPASDGSLTVRVRAGDALPLALDPSGTLVFTSVSYGGGFNDAGEFLFWGGTPSGPFMTDSNLYLSKPDGGVELIENIALEPPPSCVPAGWNIVGPQQGIYYRNLAGDFAIRFTVVDDAGLLGSAPIFLFQDQSCASVGILGSAAPTVPSVIGDREDAVFTNSAVQGAKFNLNEDGDLIFRAGVEVPGFGLLGEGIFLKLAEANSPVTIAVEGQTVAVENPEALPPNTPMAPTPWTLSSIETATPSLSAEGATAFLVKISEGLLSTEFGAVLYADALGHSWLMAYEGQSVDFLDGSTQEILSLDLADAVFPETVVNRHGVAFSFTVVSGSGDVVAFVPEPALWVSVASALATLVCLKRSRLG